VSHADLRAALAHAERMVARLRRLLSEQEQQQATRDWLNRETERDVLAFDRVASNA
jgi:hypothetical protein